MPLRLQFGFCLLLLTTGAMVAAPPPAAPNTLTAVRFWTLGDTTRVVIETSEETKYKQDRVSDPDRLFFDFTDTSVKLTSGKRHGAITVGDPRLKQIRIAETQPGVARVVFDLEPGVEYSASRLKNPSRLIVELKAASTSATQPSVISSTLPSANAAAPKLPAVTRTNTEDSLQGAPAAGLPSAPTRTAAEDRQSGGRGQAGTTPAVSTQASSTKQSPATRVNREQQASVPATSAGATPPLSLPSTTQPSRTKTAVAKPSRQEPAGQPSLSQDFPSQRPAKLPPGPKPGLEESVPEPVLTADAAPQLPLKTATPASIAAAVPPGNSVQTAKAKLPPPPKPATIDSSQSMTRILGLKVGRIVLDPGHGGHDTGTIGPNGLYEKDVVLDIAQRLGVLIESRLGAEVVFTRSDDTFIPLERRGVIANEQKADLFLSIHANSSPLSVTSGVETYYLNFTDSKQALEIAARENAGSSRTVYDLKDLIQKIALHDKIEESRQFATRVQTAVQAASLKTNPRSRDRGVRKAPFVVLIGTTMPSVLAEVGFVTNPKDEALFRKQDYRQKLAEGLFQGVARYAGTLSQFQVAQK